MAHFDEIGEYGLSQVLAKRLTTPGGSVAPTVAPELFPALTLENDRPEWSFLKGENLCSRYCTVAALAGNYSMVQLYLPTTARTVAVITAVDANSAGIQVGRLVGISGGLGGWAARTTANRDTRNTGSGSSCILETNQNVALPNNFGTLFYQAAARTWTQPIVLAPGGAIGFWIAALNTAIDFNLAWYERTAQPGEL